MTCLSRCFKLSYCFLALSPIFVSPSSFSDEKRVESEEWIQISNATATWMFFDVYNARLFSQQPFLSNDFLSDSQPLKLEFCYLKDLSAGVFVEGANNVLPKTLTPSLQAEVERLHESYQSVKAGDCYILEYAPEFGTQLKLNHQPLFDSQKEGFKSVYFGVWLGENPLSKSLRSNLLGR